MHGFIILPFFFASPLNCDAGNMLRAGDMRAYKSMVTLYCKEHCRPVLVNVVPAQE